MVSAVYRFPVALSEIRPGQPLTPKQLILARDLRVLRAMGLIEQFTDERGITRFRPAERGVSRAFAD